MYVKPGDDSSTDLEYNLELWLEAEVISTLNRNLEFRVSL